MTVSKQSVPIDREFLPFEIAIRLQSTSFGWVFLSFVLRGLNAADRKKDHQNRD